MKKIYWFILESIFATAILTGCLNEDFDPQEWAITPEFSFSNSGIVFNSLIGSEKIIVSTNYKSYEAVSNEEWCHTSIDKDSLYVTVDPNDETKQRTATISVSVKRGSKTLTKEISVVQMGGVWDMIGPFNIFWRYEISEGQRAAIEDLLNSLVFVEGGNFNMGEGDDEHQVTLSSFYIGKFEITQKQWNAIMALNPSIHKGSDLPVENISWADALKFTTAFSSLTNLSICLPTEAQWEYAAKGGRFSKKYVYPGSNDYKEIAYYIDSSTSKDSPLYTTVKGGTKLPNELGLYDMAGNVSEYCFDWYGNYEDVKTNKDPSGVESGLFKVVRGGDFTMNYYWFKSSMRWQSFSLIDRVRENIGLRIVLKP